MYLDISDFLSLPSTPAMLTLIRVEKYTNKMGRRHVRDLYRDLLKYPYDIILPLFIIFYI